MDTIKFPLQFAPGGLRKAVDGTDDYYKQILSMTILYEPGVSPLTPTYGIFDPTFREVDKGQFVVQAAKFVPEVIIESVDAELQEDGITSVSFSFRKRQ